MERARANLDVAGANLCRGTHETALAEAEEGLERLQEILRRACSEDRVAALGLMADLHRVAMEAAEKLVRRELTGRMLAYAGEERAYAPVSS